MDDKKHVVSCADLYGAVVNLVIHSEQIRWVRFNNLIMINTILILAWSAIWASSSGSTTQGGVVMTLICLPGMVAGIIFGGLGSRTSEYHMLYAVTCAKAIEEHLPPDLPKPLTMTPPIRKHSFPSFTSSTQIVTYGPVLFSVLFLSLAFLSWWPPVQKTDDTSAAPTVKAPTK